MRPWPSRLIILAALFGLAGAAQARELRVCADPNNLPFSNDKRQGFENQIVELIAKDLGAQVHYVWWAQRRGNVRNTLNAGECDLIPGMATEVDMTATSKPYYRSTYVFVSRAGSGLDIASFDDPRLRELKIGVQMVGDDFANTPPAHALARRGIIGNVRGYMLYGDYSTPAPTETILRAVATREIDLAVVWGPLAGYFATRESVKLGLTPVSPRIDAVAYPMTFDISMAVRKGDRALLGELNAALDRNHDRIAQILRDYGVPTLNAQAITTSAP